MGNARPLCGLVRGLQGIRAVHLSDEQVQAQFQEFKLIQADVTRNNAQDVEILSRYKVLGLPTILFFDPEGNERPEYRVTGYMNAEDFKKHLEKIVSE